MKLRRRRFLKVFAAGPLVPVMWALPALVLGKGRVAPGQRMTVHAFGVRGPGWSYEVEAPWGRCRTAVDASSSQFVWCAPVGVPSGHHRLRGTLLHNGVPRAQAEFDLIASDLCFGL